MSDLGRGRQLEVGTEAAPRVRIKIGVREVLLSLAILGVGIFLTQGIVVNPGGNTLRRSTAGIAAVVIGLAGIGVSVGRACSGCGGWLRSLSIRGSAVSLSILAQALDAGDGPATETALRGAANSSASSTAGSVDIAYCEGCGQLVTWRGAAQGPGAGTAGKQTATVVAARKLVPVLAAYRALQEPKA